LGLFLGPIKIKRRPSGRRFTFSTYFFDGHGAPQGAQAPAKSSGDTARPLDGLVR
jgi:hypothetical protein